MPSARARAIGINMFCMSLMKEENRRAFKADEAQYLKKFKLTPAQTAAILKRDYNRMLELGGNIYFTAKLGATDGHSFQHLAAVMTGNTQARLRRDDARRRPLGRWQPLRSGKNAPSKFIAKAAAARKPAGAAARKPAVAKAKAKTKSRSAKRK